MTTHSDQTGDLDDRALRIAARAVQLYAETHPRPTQVTQNQAAEMLDSKMHREFPT